MTKKVINEVVVQAFQPECERLRSLQVAFATQFAKNNRINYINTMLERDVPKYAERIQKISEDLGISEKVVRKFFRAVVEHTSEEWCTADIPRVFAKILPSFNYDVTKTEKVFESIICHSASFVDARKMVQWNKVVLIPKAFLNEEERATIDRYQFKWPSVCPLDPTTPSYDGYVGAGDVPNSKGNPPNPNAPTYDLDRANSVPFTFDEGMLNNYKHKFKVKSFKGEEAFIEAFDAYNRRMKTLDQIIEIFTKNGVKEFFLPHYNDGRLRVYCGGYFINEQGTDFDKSLLAFAKKMPLNEKGIEGIKIGLANSINPKISGKSLDKMSTYQKIKWVDDHEAELEKWVSNTKIKSEYPERFQEQYVAEEPAKAHSLLYWYRKAQQGEPVGCIVHFDAKCQGAQIQSILCQDIDGMLATGAIRDEDVDFYLDCAVLCGLDPTPENRNLLKEGLKPTMYSGRKSAREIWGDELFETFWEEVPKKYSFFKKLVALYPTQWQDDWECLKWRLPDGSATQVLVKGSNQIYTATIFGYSFEGEYSQFGPNPKRACSLGPNIIHSLDGFVAREMQSRCSYEKEQIAFIKRFLNGELNHLSLEMKVYNNLHNTKDDKNFKELSYLFRLGKEFNWYSFHILDLLNHNNIFELGLEQIEIVRQMIKELPEEPFYLTRIHDSYGCHPNYWEDVCQQYRYCLAHLSQSRILQHICSDLGITLNIPEPNFMFFDEIMKSKRALG
jgi:hypothetical protein